MAENSALTQRFEQAITAFDDGNTYAALNEFVALHQEGFHREEILTFLNDVSYEPNLAEMKVNFEKNCAALDVYPFIQGWKHPAFETLSFRIYPVIEHEFFLFDTAAEMFTERISFEKDPSFDCCLKYFDEQRIFENEANISKLAYLNRNIRASEKIGLENHIYLCYDKPDVFYSLLLTNDWSTLLAEKKFVICIGEESFLKPENFSAHFQVSYENCTPQPLTVSEISRMIFGWKIANVSGTSFLADILDFHPQLLTIPDCFFNDFYPYYMKYLSGKKVKEVVRHFCSLRDEAPERSLFYSITHKLHNGVSDELFQELNRISTDELLKKTGELLSDCEIPTAREWITAIYLAFSLCHGRTFTQRVIPAVFMYPHDDMFFLAGVERNRVNFYLDTVCSFPDYKAIAIIRDPVTQAGSVIRFMTETHPQAKNKQGERQLDPFYCMAFGSLLPKDYFFRTDHVLFGHISVVRFEDLKLNPKASLESLTDFLDLSSSDILYKTTWCGLSRSGIATDGRSFEGFDPSPIYNDHARYLSTFDKYRIEMTLYQLMLNYGYRPMYYEGEDFSNNQKFILLQYPFRCESIPLVLSDEERKHSREGALNLIKSSVIFYSSASHTPVFINGFSHPFAPIPWLKPKPELLEQPLYESRISTSK